MAERQTDERMQESGTTMKRRGILRAAGMAVGAVVAGMAAKQGAAPVAAAVNLELGSTTNTESAGTGLVYTGGAFTGGAALNVVDDGANFLSVPGAMVAGLSTSGKAPYGVYGFGNTYGVYGQSGYTGVYGKGTYGVWGQGSTGVFAEGGTYGLFGGGYYGVYGRSTNYAVYGEGGSYGVYGKGTYGVWGQGNIYGIFGTSFDTGVYGQITGGAENTVAVQGENQSTGANSHGVVGRANTGHGVVGEASGTGIGVSGTSTHGIGALFKGEVAPLRLVPGTLSARTLTTTGHQAGELYFTSDNELFVFDGTNWREVVLKGPGSGVPPAAAARPATAGTTTSPVQPAPSPRP